MSIKPSSVGVGLAVLLLTPAAAGAHHSSAMFDFGKTETVQGVVQAIQWANPHVWVDVTAVGPGGVRWAAEGQSVSMLRRKGWAPDVMKPGDHVVLTIFRSRDGSNSGALRNVTLADGRVLWAYGSDPTARN